VPTVRTRRVRSPEQAERCAAELGVPVALKILSPDITHKSDVGGVQLNLITPERVRRAAEAMLERVREAAPRARIDGFTVQEMAARKDAVELIVGAAEDPLFGPVLLFGHGGTAVEVIDDKALALPPLDPLLAREMMAATRVFNLLRGYRSTPPAALDAIALALMKVSQLVIDVPEIAELDINPLLADAEGVLALDARIKVGPPRAGRLAIRPYPKRLEKTIRIADGREFLLRPIRPEDEPLIHAMVEATSPEDLRLRFFAPLKRLSPQLAARLTQIDYDREMALVAVAPGAGESGAGDGPAIYGVVRIAADPDNRQAEYAVLVRSDMKGKGLGFRLMTEILDYARGRGIGRVRGDVLAANTTMLQMCEELGFVRRRQPDDPSIMEVEIELSKEAA
jgi:acetyltransferase